MWTSVVSLWGVFFLLCAFITKVESQTNRKDREAGFWFFISLLFFSTAIIFGYTNV